MPGSVTGFGCPHLPFLYPWMYGRNISIALFPIVVYILWKWCQYPALKYISVLIFQIREVFWIFCLIHWEVKKYLISLFKFIPGINAFKDKAVLKFFLYFGLSGTFPTMIFYIVVCSTNAGWSLTPLEKQFQCCPPSMLKMYIYVTYRFLHWILKSKVGSATVFL